MCTTYSNIKNFSFCLQSRYVFYTIYRSPKRIKGPVFMMETQCVSCEACAEFLNII
jgi:formate hydrogenlyase subunit 6/NADH:ubiquinone oxidoreductase subunit I